MEHIDNYQEHELHQVYDPSCSTCFSEGLRVQESKEKSLLQELKDAIDINPMDLLQRHD